MQFVEFLKNKSGYIYSACGGMGLYFLKFLSLQVLISNISFDNYPLTLILGGISVFLLNQLNKKFISSYALNLFYFIGSVTLIVLNQAHLIDSSSNLVTTLFAGFSFAFLVTTSQFSEVILKELTINRSKSIKNSKLINKFILFEEIGLLVAASSMLFLKDTLPSFIILTIGLAPLAAMLFFTRFNNSEVTVSNRVNEQPQESIFRHSFAIYAVLLVSTLFLLKQLYSYGAFIGFKQLDQTGMKFETVFALINIAQTIAVFSIIGIKIFFQKNNISWNRGVKLFLNAQFFIFSALVFLSSPILLVSASALRKTLAHTILNESLKLLHVNYPRNVKIQIQHLTNSYAGLGSYFIVAGIAFLTSENIIDLKYVWSFAIVCAAFGIYFRKKLLNALLEFQITNIMQKNVYEAVNSCYSLAHKEARIYAPSIGSLLQKNPRPMLTKAIIYTLGEMQNSISIDLLIKKYQDTEREDIQLTIIQALIKFESHHVDLFLLECLESMVLSQVSLGEIRRTVFESITSKVKNVAIPMTLKLLRNNEENQRVLANIVLILGELALHKNDISLYELLVTYTQPKYSRRIRSNAFIYIYKHKKYQEYAMGGISSFIVSSDEHDRSAAAFLAGELELKGMLYFVRELSKESNQKNSTIETSLLKLGDKNAACSVARIIFSDASQSSATCLNQLNSIPSDYIRYQVYNIILDDYPERLGEFMRLLSESKRNFDDDRRKIYDVAKSRNIVIDDREFVFESEVLPELADDTKLAS